MAADAGLCAELAGGCGDGSAGFALHLGGRQYPMSGVSVAASGAPVGGPTLRGGAYVAAGTDYKMRGTVADPSIIPQLTGAMLGPSTEFGSLRVTSGIGLRGGTGVEIEANLTDSVQRPGAVELGLLITGIRVTGLP